MVFTEGWAGGRGIPFAINQSIVCTSVRAAHRTHLRDALGGINYFKSYFLLFEFADS